MNLVVNGGGLILSGSLTSETDLVSDGSIVFGSAPSSEVQRAPVTRLDALVVLSEASSALSADRIGSQAKTPNPSSNLSLSKYESLVRSTKVKTSVSIKSVESTVSIKGSK